MHSFSRFSLVVLLLSLSVPSFAQSAKLPPGSAAPSAPGQTPAAALSSIENDIAAGKYNAAETRLHTFLSKYPQNDRAYFDLGYCEDAQGHTDAAATDFRKALAINPEDLSANYNLMLAYTGLGNRKLAHDFEVRYLRFKADNAEPARVGGKLGERGSRLVHQRVVNPARVGGGQRFESVRQQGGSRAR